MTDKFDNIVIVSKKNRYWIMSLFESANTYITSPRVAELNVSGEDVHQQLWPLFQQLLSSSSSSPATTSEWQYAHSFNYAVDSVSHEYKITKNDILETKDYQLRVCFYFIMHIHH
jgi:hypothetical protein